MSARTKARKRALDILFQSDVRGDDLPAMLAVEARRAANEPARESSWLYARDIVDGIIDNRDEIDEQITTHARDWSLAWPTNLCDEYSLILFGNPYCSA